MSVQSYLTKLGQWRITNPPGCSSSVGYGPSSNIESYNNLAILSLYDISSPVDTIGLVGGTQAEFEAFPEVIYVIPPGMSPQPSSQKVISLYSGYWRCEYFFGGDTITISPDKTWAFLGVPMGNVITFSVLPRECDSISDSFGVDLESASGHEYLVAGALGAGLASQVAATVTESFPLVPYIPVRSLSIRSLGLTCLRAGSVGLKILSRGIPVLTTALAIYEGAKIVRWLLSEPYSPSTGDVVEIEYNPDPITTCPTKPTSSEPVPTDPYPPGGDEGGPGDSEEPPPKTDKEKPSSSGLDPCCAATVQALNNITDGIDDLYSIIKWFGGVHDQFRKEAIREFQRLLKLGLEEELKKIAKGVYLSEDQNLDEKMKPLAKIILSVLNGLDINPVP